jgi:beta-lactam-binding protein with PASTA domain
MLPLASPRLPRPARTLLVVLVLLLALPAARAQQRLEPGRPVPDLVGRSTAEVYAELGDAVEYVGVDAPGSGEPGEPADCVKYQYPSAGTALGEGEKLILFASPTVTVPKIEGLGVFVAQEWLESMCLSVGVATKGGAPATKCDYATCPAPTDSGTIKEQCTPAGSTVSAGDVICVVLAPLPSAMGWVIATIVLALVVLVLLLALMRKRAP